MFEADRTFYIKNQTTGTNKWYFQAREGNIGAFVSRQEAHFMLKKFIKECIKSGKTGRSKTKETDSMQSNAKSGTQTVLNYIPKDKILWF